MAEQGFKGLLDGLKDRSPEACDKSCELPKGPSVNEDAVRSSVAETPPTLGPRNA
jgi:hypothetical protein